MWFWNYTYAKDLARERLAEAHEARLARLAARSRARRAPGTPERRALRPDVVGR